jgi:hypothetical protein
LNASILYDVAAECARQRSLWGEQNHPIGASTIYKTDELSARVAFDYARRTGQMTWRHIASEEFWEAFAELDPTKRRTELVQLAAVIVSAIASEDRRAAAASIEVPAFDANGSPIEDAVKTVIASDEVP